MMDLQRTMVNGSSHFDAKERTIQLYDAHAFFIMNYLHNREYVDNENAYFARI